ncbi:hypothetical protein [Vulgatibacter sp.]|uniref:hypothetical protein n=1 Tax=Vulgatibacter sp. TaxID=1971226 RepID=UPI0035656F72
MSAVPKKGTRVRFQVETEEQVEGVTGVVTYQRGRTIRLVDSHGRRYTNARSKGANIALTAVRPIRFGLFVFDTRLDRSLASQRQAGRFWQEYCDCAGWSQGSERVHSLEDLRYFLGRAIPGDVLIFSGHGHESRGFRLSNGELLDGRKKLEINPANHDKVVLFSSCQVGRTEKMAQRLRESLQARAIIAYSTDVLDDIAFVAEPLLLQLLAAGKSPTVATEMVAAALDPWKTLNQRRARRFPLVCYER